MGIAYSHIDGKNDNLSQLEYFKNYKKKQIKNHYQKFYILYMKTFHKYLLSVNKKRPPKRKKVIKKLKEKANRRDFTCSQSS